MYNMLIFLTNSFSFTAVSLSDPVEVATGNVEYQVQRNCVKFTIHGITLEEVRADSSPLVLLSSVPKS